MTDTVERVKTIGAARASSPAWLRRWVSRQNVYDIATTAFFIVLTAVTLATLKDYAISNDEPVQHRYGELIIAYYRSGFADRSLFDFKDLYLYGGLFDVVAVGLSWVLPVDAYQLRHFLCLIAGLGGLAAVTATARLLAGPRAGLLAVLCLAGCGAWYGAMFNHTKDIPFAAAMAGATLMLIRCARALPMPRWRDVAALGLLVGAALGIRVLGLLAVVYIVFTILLFGPRPWAPFSRERIGFMTRSALMLLPALVLAYLIMIVVWPWSVQAPLNPLRGLVTFSEYHITIRTQLAGKVYEMATVPRLYIPIYLLIRIPLITLGGALLAIAFALWPRPASVRVPRREILLIVLMVLFPVVSEVITRGPAFTGLRHFMFVLPMLAVLAGVGLDAALAALARRQAILGRAALAGVVAMFAWNAVILVRLHPYQSVAYNSLVGGVQGAVRHYDMDYWFNSMPEAVRMLEAYLRRTEPLVPGRPRRIYSVAVCGEQLAFEKLVTLPQLEYDFMSEWEESDFFIAPTQMYCDRILDGKVIGVVERLGAPIAYVKDRRDWLKPDRTHGP